DADALSHLESLGIWTYRRDPADDLVAESRGVLRDAPVIVEGGEVRVTQTTVFDGDFNVLGPERSEIDGFKHHRLFRRLCSPCLMIHRVPHDCLLLLLPLYRSSCSSLYGRCIEG